MAGPVFSFYLPTFTPAMVEELESILSAISKTVHRTKPRQSGSGNLYDATLHVETPFIPMSGTIGVHVDRHSDDYYSAAITAAFNDIFGFAPLIEIGGYCMAKGENDWDALRLIARRVSAAFGALVVLERNDGSLPDLPSGCSVFDNTMREVVASDEAAFFGDMIHDEAYVQQTRHLVPIERYWVIDSTISPGFWVGK